MTARGLKGPLDPGVGGAKKEGGLNDRFEPGAATSGGWLRRISDAIGLREGEGGRTGRLFAFIFLLTVAFVLSKAAQRALFLAAYPRSRIPDAFIISALSLAAASFLASALAARMGPTRLVLALLGVSTGLLLGARLALAGEVPAAPMALYVLIEVVIGLLVVQSWTVVTEVLDVRSAKRLLPLIGNAAGIAWALGGFAVPAIVGWIGTADLLVLAAALLAAAGLAVRVIERRDLGGRAARGARGTTLWAGARAGMRYVRKVPLLRVLAVITVLGLLIELVLDFQLLAAAQSHYATAPDRISSFMGLFFGITGAAGLLAPLLFSGRVLTRFGSAKSTLVEPACVLVGALLFFAVPEFAVIVAVRGAHRLFGQALSSPARAQIQTTIPSVRRAQASALLKGVLAPLFYAAGGAVMKLLPGDLDIKWLALPAAGFAAAMLWTVGRGLGSAYLSALRHSVDRRQLDLDGAAAAVRRGTRLLDGEHRATLAEESRSAEPARAAFAVSLLALGAARELRPLLLEACGHPSPEVQRVAVDALARVGADEDRATVLALLDGTGAGSGSGPLDRSVECACLRTLARLGGDRDHGAVLARCQADDLELRALARACRAAAGDASTLASFVDLVRSPRPVERTAAARALGETGLLAPTLLEPFAELLADPDLEVRRTAIQAAGRLRHPQFVAAIVSAFGDDDTAQVGFAAFADLAEDLDRMIDQVERALEGASDEIVARTAAALAAGVGPCGDQLLGHLLEHEHRIIRHRAARALAARRHAPTWQPPPMATVTAAVRTELATGYGYYALLAGIARTDGVIDFEIEPEYQFIATEIRIRIRQTQERLFGLLALVARPRLISSASLQLRRADPRAAARAIELLEHALSRDLARLVVPFFEPRSLRERLREVSAELEIPDRYLEDPLAGLMALEDSHLRCCAVLCYRDRMAREFPDAYREAEAVLPLVQRIHFLRRVPLFGELSGEDLLQVAEIAEQVEQLADQVVFHKGDPGDVLFLIVRGRVAVRDGGHDIAVLGPMEFFGELAVLDDEPRSATTVCVEDSELLSIAGADLEELMERRPAIAREIIRVLTRRLRESTARMAEAD